MTAEAWASIAASGVAIVVSLYNAYILTSIRAAIWQERDQMKEWTHKNFVRKADANFVRNAETD